MSVQYTAWCASCHTAPSPQTSPVGATQIGFPIFISLRSPPANLHRCGSLRRYRMRTDPRAKTPPARRPLRPFLRDRVDELFQIARQPRLTKGLAKNELRPPPASACESIPG